MSSLVAPPSHPLLRAIATHPDTPTAALDALALTCDPGTILADHLAANPACTVDLPQAPDLPRNAPSVAIRSADLTDVIAGACDQGRRRALARHTTTTLWTLTCQGRARTHPAVVTELASRPPTGTHLDDTIDAFCFAHPGVPHHRRLDAALRVAGLHPLKVVSLVRDLHIDPAHYRAQLVHYVATHHPDRLEDLTRAAQSTDLRAAARHTARFPQDADAPDVGLPLEDVTDLAHRTANPAAADQVLDLATATGAGKTIMAHARRIARSVAFAGTPVHLRARVILELMPSHPTAPPAELLPGAGAITTETDLLTWLLTIPARARIAPTLITPATPGAGDLLAQAWNTATTDPQTSSRRTRLGVASRFILHPDTPPATRAAAQEAARAATGDGIDLRAAVVRALTEHGTDGLLDLPPPLLRHPEHFPSEESQLLTAQLCTTLRAYVPDLTGPTTRALAGLVDTFTGTTRELLDVAGDLGT